MRKAPAIVSLFAAAAFATGALFAADTAKEVTVTGEAKCAKCALNETPACQGAIEVTQDGKATVYYLAQNDVSKAFHSKICKATVTTMVTGTVETKDGKHILTASKIAEAK